jgi:hypothetical protein
MFIKTLPCKGNTILVFQLSCHIAPSLRLFVSSRSQAYCHFFFCLGGGQLTLVFRSLTEDSTIRFTTPISRDCLRASMRVLSLARCSCCIMSCSLIPLLHSSQIPHLFLNADSSGAPCRTSEAQTCCVVGTCENFTCGVQLQCSGTASSFS